MQGVRNYRCIVLGVGRNVEKYLDRVVRRVTSSFSNFKDVHYFFGTSHCQDKTENLLDAWSRKVPNLTHIRIPTNTNLGDARTHRIAEARNYLQNYVLYHVQHSFDYVAFVDLDFVNYDLTRDAVESCWEISGWDVITANQKHFYYDLWALRHVNWLPGDCVEDMKSLESIFGKKEAFRLAVKSRFVKIKREQSPIQVTSAFGGAAIYTKESFFQSEYVGLGPGNIERCEHVAKNLEISNNGGNIFINPRFINWHNSPIALRLDYRLG